MRDLTLSFIRRHRLEDSSDAFKEGLDCFFEDLEVNLPRLSIKELSEHIEDRMERARQNFFNAPLGSDEREFQRGFIVACCFFLDI